MNLDTPLHIKKAYNALQQADCIPEKSKKNYYAEYNLFCLWKQEEGIPETCNTEDVVGIYLEKRSEEVVSTSLFPILSKLKAVLWVEHNVKINVDRINLQLKNKLKRAHHQPKQAKIF